MARERYPSDDRRLKKRPHVTVDLTARSHRKIGPAFADPASRGVVLGLWMLGREAWATRTGDIVTLTHGDLAWLTGRERPAAALAELVRVCGLVGYAVWIHPRGCPVPSWHELRTELARTPCEPGADPVRSPCGVRADSAPLPRQFGAVSVHVRNLAKRQGLDSATRGDATRTPQPSGTGAGTGAGAVERSAESRSEPPTTETPRPPTTDGPERTGKDRRRELLPTLPDDFPDGFDKAFCERLARENPHGLTSLTSLEVLAWLATKWPLMRDRGVRRPRSAAVRWWSKVRMDEIEAAREYLAQASGVREREPPPDPLAGLSAEEIADRTRELFAGRIGGTA
jgi:hypothetical protein